MCLTRFPDAAMLTDINNRTAICLEKNMDKKRILIVQDDAVAADRLQAGLIQLGYEVLAIVSTGADAVRTAAELHPDLVLMDVVLDGRMSGIEAAGRIWSANAIPVVYVTAHDDIQTIKSVKVSEPYGYITKPYSMSMLQSTVETALYKSEIDARLRESEEKYSKAFQTSPYAITITRSQDGAFIEVNDAFTVMTEYTREEALADSSVGLRLWANEQDRQGVVAALRDGLSIAGREYRFLTKSGRVITALFSAQAIQLRPGPCILSSINDITERKQAEDALRKEHVRLAGIIKGTNVGTWEWNIQTGEAVFNARWAEIIGYTVDEISPASIETWIKFAHPDDLKISGELLAKHFRRELDYYEFESRMKHKDGNWVWILDRGQVATWTADGKPLMMMGTHQDITGRKKAEATLKHSQENYRIITDQSPIAIELYNAEGLLVNVNPACEELFGLLDATEIENFSLFDDPNISDAHKDELRSGKTIRYQSVFDFDKVKEYDLYSTSKSGKLLLDMIIAPTRDDDGVISGYLLQIQDITECTQRAMP